MPGRLIPALAAASLMCPVPLWAAPPPGADPDLAPWFRSLRQPNTDMFIGGEFARWQNPPYAWVDVPDGSVLHRHDNPTGEGVACWAGMRIICFVEGTGA
jgi:hypothetical protein